MRRASAVKDQAQCKPSAPFAVRYHYRQQCDEQAHTYAEFYDTAEPRGSMRVYKRGSKIRACRVHRRFCAKDTPGTGARSQQCAAAALQCLPRRGTRCRLSQSGGRRRQKKWQAAGGSSAAGVQAVGRWCGRCVVCSVAGGVGGCESVGSCERPTPMPSALTEPRATAFERAIKYTRHHYFEIRMHDESTSTMFAVCRLIDAVAA